VARIKTKTGNGVSLWTDNQKTTRVASVPEGSGVLVVGRPDALGFALTEFEGNRGVCDTQYMLARAETPDVLLPEPAGTPPWDGQEAWQKIAAIHALLTEAANMTGDMLQNFGQ
jgi:hypothetical protein